MAKKKPLHELISVVARHEKDDQWVVLDPEHIAELQQEMKPIDLEQLAYGPAEHWGWYMDGWYYKMEGRIRDD